LFEGSSVPLGANVESVGRGVGDSEHSVRVVSSVGGAELREELCFDVIPQFEVFLRVDVVR